MKKSSSNLETPSIQCFVIRANLKIKRKSPHVSNHGMMVRCIGELISFRISACYHVFDQYQDKPVYVVGSTFGGPNGLGNQCSNGGAISSIGVSWSIINSDFVYNKAVGRGGNPVVAGSPGGGSGGAIYNDGNKMTLSICGTHIQHNEAAQHGSAIFFVSNDHSGNIVIDRSTITNNLGGSWYPTWPQISNHDDTPITVNDSTIE